MGWPNADRSRYQTAEMPICSRTDRGFAQKTMNQDQPKKFDHNSRVKALLQGLPDVILRLDYAEVEALTGQRHLDQTWNQKRTPGKF